MNSSDNVNSPATAREHRETLVSGPSLMALVIFLVSGLGYALFWSTTAGCFFGGDVVNQGWGRATSYRLHVDSLGDLPAFCRLLAQTSDSEQSTEAATFLWSMLGQEARLAAQNLAKGSNRSRDVSFLFHILNRDIVDQPIQWPTQLLQGVTPDKLARAADIQAKNILILASCFPQNIRPTKRALLTPFPLSVLDDLEYYFTLSNAFRYAPLGSFYSHTWTQFLRNSPQRMLWALITQSILYAILTSLIFLLARAFIDSTLWVLFAVFLCQASIASITSVYTLYSLPYLLVTICIVGGLICYLQYVSQNRWLMLIGYIAFGLVGPWVREFAGILPFLVAGNELMNFDRRRSPTILAVSFALVLHGVCPSFLPWLIGLNKGQVLSLFSMGKTVTLSASKPNWHLNGVTFVQIAPTLWLLTVLSALFHIVRWTPANEGSDQRSPLWRQVWLSMVPTSGVGLRIFKFLSAVALASSAIVFAKVFYSDNLSLDHPSSVVHGHVLFTFMILFALISFRWGTLLPLYFLAFLVGFMRWAVAEVHLSFLMPPLAILVTLWLRSLWISLLSTERTWRSKALVGGFSVLLFLGALDQFSNVVACANTQKYLVETNREIASWIRANTERHSAVISNFYYYTDIHFYSERHFDAYMSLDNDPNGGQNVIMTDAQMKNLLSDYYDIKDIYFLGADHKYFDYQTIYHRNKWVHSPPGDIDLIKRFPLRIENWYSDPFKYFTPRFWVSFPGYMDWSIDYCTENSSKPFIRTVWSNYSCCRLKAVLPEYCPPDAE